MASRAHERAQKILGNPTEEQLAQLIMHDISAQSANVEDLGVLAYARKPVHREKPNERFLLGTIRSVAFANRKAEEDEMWNQRRHRLSSGRDGRLHRGMRSNQMPAQSFRQNGGNHDSDTSDERETDCRVDEARDAAGEAMSDEQLAEILAKRRIRGRGGVGSRADEVGPFLSASAAADDELREEEDSRQHARSAGPERPSWLPPSRDPSPDRHSPADRPMKKLKAEKQHKKGKKHKKDKQHKEKRRRVKEREA